MMKSHNEHWGDQVVRLSNEFSSLVVGIDPQIDDIPEVFFKKTMSPVEGLAKYVNFVLSCTKGCVGFVKFQSGFFEAFGSSGVKVLAQGIARAKNNGHAVLLDAKRNDIGSTVAAYAKAYLTPKSAWGGSDLEVDCLTVGPFLGPETLEPFVDCSRKYGKGIVVLTKTSNPGSAWIQDLVVDDQKISSMIAKQVNRWSQETMGAYGLSAVGAVVGATYPEEGAHLRKIMPNAVFLAPGLGAQGAGIDDMLPLTRPEDGSGVLISASRGVTKPLNMAVTFDEYGELITSRIHGYNADLEALKAARPQNGHKINSKSAIEKKL